MSEVPLYTGPGNAARPDQASFRNHPVKALIAHTWAAGVGIERDFIEFLQFYWTLLKKIVRHLANCTNTTTGVPRS